MIDHKHHLIENGTMFSCDVPRCPIQGKPFLLAGGSGDPGGWKDEVAANSNIESLEREVQELMVANEKLREENEELRKALKGFCPGLFGEE